MGEKRISIKPRAVVEYWKNKYITKSGKVGNERNFKKEKEENIPVIYDWGEPCCFACNVSFDGAYNNEKYEELLESDDWPLVWEYRDCKKQFELCHIVPLSLGGETIPENIFIMCGRCHKDSPDTIYKEQFFKWVFQRRKDGPFLLRSFKKANVILNEEYGLKNYSIPTKNDLFKQIQTHGFSYEESSIVASLVGYAINKKTMLNGGGDMVYEDIINNTIDSFKKKYKDDVDDCTKGLIKGLELSMSLYKYLKDYEAGYILDSNN